MEHAAAVREGDRLAHAQHDPQHTLERRPGEQVLGPLGEDDGQGTALDELHHEGGRIRAGRDEQVVDGDDVRVLVPAQRPSLVEEGRLSRRAVDGPHDLERHGAPEQSIAGASDLAAPTAPERPFVLEPLAERERTLGHGECVAGPAAGRHRPVFRRRYLPAGTRARRPPMVRAAWVAILVLAVALRAYPLHVLYLHPDQELQPGLALDSLVRESWRPASLVYPTGFFTLLRLTCGAIYLLGLGAGWWVDRVDFAGTAIESPFLLYVPPRALACLFGVATVWLTGALAATLFGPRAGLAAAALLAVAPLAVRESHHGSLDAAATAMFTATLLAAARYRRDGDARTLVLAGAAAGATLAFRYQLAAVVLAVPLAEWLRAERAAGGTRRLAAAALAAGASFTVLNLFPLLDPWAAWADMQPTLKLAYDWWGPRSLPIAYGLQLASGTLACLLGAMGIVLALRSSPRSGVLPLVVAAGVLVPLCPLIAVFAAGAVATVTARLRVGPTLAAVTLVALAAAGPAGRSLAMVRLLGREDTRVAAGRWLVTHTPSDAVLVLPGDGAFYENPALPVTSWRVVERVLTPDVRKALAARGRPRLAGPVKVGALQALPRPGSGPGRKVYERWRNQGATIVMAMHPWLAHWVPGDPVSLAFIQHHAALLAQFTGTDDRATPAPVFDPLDANYVPLANFAGVRAPGPNITIRKFGPLAPAPEAGRGMGE